MMQRERANRLKNGTNDHGYSKGVGFFGCMQGFACNEETAGEVAEPPDGSSAARQRRADRKPGR